MPLLQRYFPALAVIVSIFAYKWPHNLTNFQSWIVYLLGTVMFCMGTTLTLNDFKRALQRYPIILLGLTLQFGFMPLIAWQLSRYAELSSALTAGMILVGSVSGGTASNVICYISKADVALSITLTAISTCLAVVLTPMLAYAYLNHTVEVDIIKMMMSIFYVVILPVSLGILLNLYLRIIILPIQKLASSLSILLICFIIAIIVALNKTNLSAVSLVLVGLVLTHNIAGLGLGYFTTLLITRDKTLSKTIAIEVGMQNSGLAAALAVKFFSVSSALPAALFSVIHNVTGPLLASYWSNKSR